MGRPPLRDNDSLYRLLMKLKADLAVLARRSKVAVGRGWRLEEDDGTGELLAVIPGTGERVILATPGGAPPTSCDQVVTCVNDAIDAGDIVVGGGGAVLMLGTVTAVEPLGVALDDGTAVEPGALTAAVYTVGDRVWAVGSGDTWLVLGHPRGAQLTFASNTIVSIPDDPGSGAGGTAVTSTIVVTDITGNAPATLRVGVNITHPYPPDLVVTLITPAGGQFIVHNRAEGFGGPGGAGIDTEYVVNASASPANGTWTLKMQDFSGGDIGRLNSWYLTFAG